MSLESERFVQEMIASGRFSSREAVLDEAVRLLRTEFQQDGDEVPSDLTAQEWCERFERWADSHQALPREADDSRESVYSGRGE